MRVLLRELGVPRRELRPHLIRPTVRRRREDAALGSEEVQLEFLEWGLGKVDECGGQLARHRIGLQRAGELHVGVEAICRENDPVSVARLRVADVDGPGYR